MGRGKGPGGITIKEAVKHVIEKEERMIPKDMLNKVKEIGPWSDNAIYRHIMGLIINLQPGYWEWPQFKVHDKCLFLKEDGYIEKYDIDIHGRYQEGIKIN
jgi:hypothetical protein